MEKVTRIIRNYPNISFRYTKGKVDIFANKQFHNYYEFYLLLNGNVEFTNDHTRTKLAPNNLVIIPPGEYHRFVVSEDSTDIYKRCVLNVSPELFGGTVLDEALCGKELLFLKPNDRIVENFLYLKNAMTKNNEKDFGFILSAIATDIVFLIKQNTALLENTSSHLLHPLSFQIMDYINQNYKSGITLNDIAKRFFLSVSSVSHIFKNNYGISIKKYITEKRMNQIHICLQNGEKPQEVASDFGFSNYSTFYRSYKGHFGTPPSHIHRKNKKTAQ